MGKSTAPPPPPIGIEVILVYNRQHIIQYINVQAYALDIIDLKKVLSLQKPSYDNDLRRASKTFRGHVYYQGGGGQPPSR